MMKRALVLALSLAVLPAMASAQSILRFEDLNVGTSVTPGALTSLGLSWTDAADEDDFTAQLSGGGWDLVILGEQNSGFYGGAMQTALTAYIAGGGKVLATSWQESPLAQDMGAGVVVDFNGNPIITDAHAIFAGTGATIALSNPGWGIFSQSYSAAAGSQCLGSLGAGCAAILGHSEHTLLLGPLFDTYADQAQGELFAANGIEYLLGQQQVVPEPITMLLLGTGLAGIGAVRRRRNLNQK